MDSMFHHKQPISAFQIKHDFNVSWLITDGVSLFPTSFLVNPFYLNGLLHKLS